MLQHSDSDKIDGLPLHTLKKLIQDENKIIGYLAFSLLWPAVQLGILQVVGQKAPRCILLLPKPAKHTLYFRLVQQYSRLFDLLCLWAIVSDLGGFGDK